MATKAELRARGIQEGYRSGLEEALAEQLEKLGVPIEFETMEVRYVRPATWHRYTPDFLLPNGIVIESKGRFITADRQKHKLIAKQHPNLDLRFVFSNPRQRISKRSKTTYAMWCEKEGLLYAAKLIPLAWIQEPYNEARWEAANNWIKQKGA